MERLSCTRAKSIDIVTYLASLGIRPQKVRGDNHWYLSPFRDEKAPSFKVAKTKNVWYDHGTGMGGDLLRFGVLFYQCSLRDFLEKLSQQKSLFLSFHQPVLNPQKLESKDENKLLILSVSRISNETLIDYIKDRGIPFSLAKKYLKEVCFRIGEKNYQALAFENSKGGYELRRKNFKGSSSPKDVRLIKNDGATIAVFEGFFSFLSYLTLKINGHPNCFQNEKVDPSFLILNSLSFVDKTQRILDTYGSTQLYLDRDEAGKVATQKLLQHSKNFEDKSSLYEGHKDLNDYLVHQLKMKQRLEKKMTPKQRMYKGRRI